MAGLEELDEGGGIEVERMRGTVGLEGGAAGEGAVGACRLILDT